MAEAVLRREADTREFPYLLLVYFLPYENKCHMGVHLVFGHLFISSSKKYFQSYFSTDLSSRLSVSQFTVREQRQEFTHLVIVHHNGKRSVLNVAEDENTKGFVPNSVKIL